MFVRDFASKTWNKIFFGVQIFSTFNYGEKLCRHFLLFMCIMLSVALKYFWENFNDYRGF